MPIGRKCLSGNLQRVRENIASAAARARRDPSAIGLVAITKSADVQDIKDLVELGVTDLGESRAQQLLVRAGEIAQWSSRSGRDGPTIRWHMVGHLQRNKVKTVLEVCNFIHSVDSLRLAEEINARAERLGRVVEILLQVNCSEEPQKSGVAVAAASHLVELISTLKCVRPAGLMTMAPLTSDPEEARVTFVRLREIFEEMRNDKLGGKDLRHLSMGMSQDYAVAVEEGATLLRIGTALFGPGK